MSDIYQYKQYKRNQHMNQTAMGELYNKLNAGEFADIEQVKAYIKKSGLKSSVQQLLKAWEDGHEAGVDYDRDHPGEFAWAEAVRYVKRTYGARP
jgi:hypothetical protein